ncbi:MAG: 3-isopropylmalate dehydratase large subunit [Candidatus Altiarchaeales archaeon ex4484_43]|nr:MAG: 3-isopropylmalate dehydratase large subunit [Candidatus Altiarchaeales archaeon ex4484_43]
MPTISEKILAEKSGKKRVEPGEIIEARVDYVMLNDVTGLPAFEVFKEFRTEPLTDRVVLIPDHYVPNKDIASAEQAKAMREFAKKYKIKNYFEVGRGGVCHQLMIEEGFVAPGRLIVGADSHTCSYGALGSFATGIGSTEAAAVMATGKLWFKVPETQKFIVDGKLNRYVMGKDIILHIIGDIGVSGSLYKTMEFYGSAISKLSLSDRITIANMAIEAGGKAGIIPPDRRVFDYLNGRVRGNYREVYSDPDAVYSCTNGRIEDLRIAAEILKGKKIHEDVRMIVVPASKRIFEQAVEEGLIKIFMDADAYVSGPTCGACLGGYMGVLAKGEVCISSTNRNFIGRSFPSIPF